MMTFFSIFKVNGRVCAVSELCAYNPIRDVAFRKDLWSVIKSYGKPKQSTAIILQTHDSREWETYTILKEEDEVVVEQVDHDFKLAENINSRQYQDYISVYFWYLNYEGVETHEFDYVIGRHALDSDVYSGVLDSAC